MQELVPIGVDLTGITHYAAPSQEQLEAIDRQVSEAFTYGTRMGTTLKDRLDATIEALSRRRLISDAITQENGGCE